MVGWQALMEMQTDYDPADGYADRAFDSAKLTNLYRRAGVSTSA